MKQIKNNPLVAAEKYSIFRFYDIVNKAFIINNLILFIANATNQIQPFIKYINVNLFDLHKSAF